MPDFTTLGAVKAECGIIPTNTALDLWITQVIPQMTQLVQDFTGQLLFASTPTEIYCGKGRSILRLNQRPVNSITAVWYDPYAAYGQAPAPYVPFAANTLLTAGIDYALVPDQPDGVTSKKGWLQKLNGVWPNAYQRTRGLLAGEMVPSQGTIKVSYASGYNPVPADLQGAVNRCIARWLTYKNRGILLSGEGLGAYHWNGLAPEDPDSILAPGMQVFLRYRAIQYA